MSDDLELQILILAGPDSAPRAAMGLNAALSAATSDLRVRVVLTMQGAHWAGTNTGTETPIPGHLSIGQLIDEVLAAGGEVRGCSSCVDQFCPAPRGDDGLKVLRPGIELIGLTVMTLHMAQVPTVSF